MPSTPRVRWAVLAAILLAALPSLANAQNLVLEWADQARDRKAILGDPVYMRTLYCDAKQGAPGCTLVVVSVSRTICPLVVDNAVFMTEGENLRASRNGDSLELEFKDFRGVTKLRLGLMTDSIGQKIVQFGSGVITFNAAGDEAVRATELIAFTRNSKGLEKHPEHEAVDLNCSKLSVVAAKKAAR